MSAILLVLTVQGPHARSGGPPDSCEEVFTLVYEIGKKEGLSAGAQGFEGGAPEDDVHRALAVPRTEEYADCEATFARGYEAGYHAGVALAYSRGKEGSAETMSARAGYFAAFVLFAAMPMFAVSWWLQ